MRAPFRLGVALGVGVSLWVASSAFGGELYATVERTAAPGERALVHVRADGTAPVTLLAYRVEDPAALLDAGLDLRDGATVYARLFPSVAAARRAAARPPALVV